MAAGKTGADPRICVFLRSAPSPTHPVAEQLAPEPRAARCGHDSPVPGATARGTRGKKTGLTRAPRRAGHAEKKNGTDSPAPAAQRPAPPQKGRNKGHALSPTERGDITDEAEKKKKKGLLLDANGT